jgi:hypothetical protein
LLPILKKTCTVILNKKVKPPKEFDALLVSKGFLDEITIQIFLLEVSLSICTLNVVVGPIKHWRIHAKRLAVSS